MDDYYKLLNIEYNASIFEINKAIELKKQEIKVLKFLNNNKILMKELKKAYVIFNNPEYKKVYDKYINNSIKNNKKKMIDNNSICSRIFDCNFNNSTANHNYNLNDNERLRPINTGLTSDIKVTFDRPLDFEESNGVIPFEESNPFNFNE